MWVNLLSLSLEATRGNIYRIPYIPSGSSPVGKLTSRGIESITVPNPIQKVSLKVEFKKYGKAINSLSVAVISSDLKRSGASRNLSPYVF